MTKLNYPQEIYRLISYLSQAGHSNERKPRKKTPLVKKLQKNLTRCVGTDIFKRIPLFYTGPCHPSKYGKHAVENINKNGFRQKRVKPRPFRESGDTRIGYLLFRLRSITLAFRPTAESIVIPSTGRYVFIGNGAYRELHIYEGASAPKIYTFVPYGDGEATEENFAKLWKNVGYMETDRFHSIVPLRTMVKYSPLSDFATAEAKEPVLKDQGIF